MDSLRILGLLLHKNYLVRKRHWIKSLFGEILLPISLIFSTRFLFDLGIYSDEYSTPRYELQSFSQLISKSEEYNNTLLYAPKSQFTDELMLLVQSCLKKKHVIQGFKKVSDITTSKSVWYDNRVVIFHEFTNYSTKHLRYIIQTDYAGSDLYLSERNAIRRLYGDIDQSFLIQICLDKSFVKIQTNSSVFQIFIQRVPETLLHHRLLFIDIIIHVYEIFFMIIFMIPLSYETFVATNEKFNGINVLMSMNGVPDILNVFGWIISGLILLSPLCVISTIPTHASILTNDGNPLVLFVFYVAHVVHVMLFGMHVSAYFRKPVTLTFALIFTNMVVVAIRIFSLDKGSSFILLCLGIIFPNILFYESLQNMRSYSKIGAPLLWSNLFANLGPDVKFSFGMTLLSSIAGIIVNFILTVYIQAISPGIYDVGKDPLFFIKFKTRNKNCIEFSPDNALDDKYCESTFVKDDAVGIRIRNLKKSFNIGPFNNKKVDALRGITMEFYKGQITSLLGPNGAGKSTLMSIITGIISPTNGQVFINSRNLKDNASEMLKEFGLCAQNDIFFPSLSVTEQLEFFAMIMAKNKSRFEVKEKVENLLKKLQLFNVKDALPSALSGDQQRKLCLGMSFVGDPSILILDEPTSRLHFESKRIIWDLLMEMKGKKTIIISTHDMEEADRLGDRIAILHEGRLKCCGSSLFLKKIIAGQNNVEITLSIARWSHPESIRIALHPEALIVNEEDRKIVISTPVTSNLSDSLRSLEMKKKDLGISSYNISLVNLERVFLEMTRNKTCQTDDGTLNIVDSSKEQVKGIRLLYRLTRALLLKKLIYTMKEPLTLLIQIVTMSIAMLAVTIALTATDVRKNDQYEDQIIDVNLGMYKHPYTLYSSVNQTYGTSYQAACQSQFGESIRISNSSLHNEMLRRAKEGIFDYKNNLIAAAEFNETQSGLIVNAIYSDRVSFSLSISINLIWNAVLKTLMGDEYSISLSQRAKNDSEISFQTFFQLACNISIILLIPLYFVGATFAIHPSRESLNGFKHLQKMTGVSSFIYWATIFIFDLIHFTCLILLLIVGLVCLDYYFDIGFNEANDIMTMLLFLMLYAINSLPLAYIFSCIKAKTNTTLKLLVFLPIATGVIEYTMLVIRPAAFLNTIYDAVRSYQKQMFLLIPHTSFLHVVTKFYTANLFSARCRRMPNNFYDQYCEFRETPPFTDYCCSIIISFTFFNAQALNCYNGSCLKQQNLVELMSFTSIDPMKSLIYFCLTPLLYFIILAAIEGQLLQKLLAKCTKQHFQSFTSEAQMQREKSVILENIQALAGNNTSRTQLRREPTVGSNSQAFMVYELQKHFGKVKAVQDVTFSVNHREFFGIYGANRSGKSVTFRMLTGEEIPDHGTILVGGKHYRIDDNSISSEIGYCPQQEALLECLNAQDHLSLFARLRGVPENQIHVQVQRWINRLNLGDYATLPSSIYSSGNKQRLNIALALIGSPKLVLFDEPTIRVDPGMRHSFWDTIKSCQAAGQTFILASHNMDECEALCSRIAIMVEGRLTCIGSPEELKQRFGAGYDVQIRFDPKTLGSQLDELKSSMRLLLPCTLTNEYSGSLIYYVSGPGTTWKRLYGILNKLKNKYEFIDDYIVIVRLST